MVEGAEEPKSPIIAMVLRFKEICLAEAVSAQIAVVGESEFMTLRLWSGM